MSLVVKDIAIDAVDQEFESQVGQIGHSVANSSAPLRRFFGVALPKSQAAETGTVSRFTFRSDAASIMKI